MVQRSLHLRHDLLPLPLLYEMTKEASAKHGDLTERNIGRCMAFILDGHLLYAPFLKSRIPGKGQISGISGKKIDEILKATGR